MSEDLYAKSSFVTFDYDAQSPERSLQDFEDRYRYAPPRITQPKERYIVGIALLVDPSPDVIETTMPEWGIIVSPINGVGLSTLYSITPNDFDETHFDLRVKEIPLFNNRSTLRSSNYVVSQVYKLAMVDNNIVPRQILHRFITSFSPNRSGTPSPLRMHDAHGHWCSLCWVARILFFMGTTGCTYADDVAELRYDEERLCSWRVQMPSVINVLQAKYVIGRAIYDLDELFERIYHHWMFHGKLQPVVPGDIPVHTLPA
ncbi:hypothetical protein CVT24_000794 [Panaeolus cyanescens]|uniref:Uncharacterized protein n=1 Tax=Panaeolus cyanescens TaxID=181874 RepID=A0A409YCN8_9AGAR|nr:hypothetical protein CVT24_000794 [Panaeolus cyanescens]